MNLGQGDFLATIMSNIERVGWMAIGVMPTIDDPLHTPFTYSIGCYGHDGHPEFIVLGLNPSLAHVLLDGLCRRVAAGERFADGEADDKVLEGYPVRFKALPPDGTPLNWARNYYGVEELPALQIVWPDKEGRFPGEEGCEPQYVTAQEIEAVRDA
jgi:uncharacterized protein DUF4262